MQYISVYHSIPRKPRYYSWSSTKELINHYDSILDSWHGRSVFTGWWFQTCFMILFIPIWGAYYFRWVGTYRPFDENGDMSGVHERIEGPQVPTHPLVGWKKRCSIRKVPNRWCSPHIKKKIGDFPSQSSWSSVFFWGGDRLVDSSPDAPGRFLVSFPWHDLEKKPHLGNRLLWILCRRCRSNAFGPAATVTCWALVGVSMTMVSSLNAFGDVHIGGDIHLCYGSFKNDLWQRFRIYDIHVLSGPMF